MPRYSVKCEEHLYYDGKIIEAANEEEVKDKYRRWLDKGGIHVYDSTERFEIVELKETN